MIVQYGPAYQSKNGQPARLAIDLNPIKPTCTYSYYPYFGIHTNCMENWLSFYGLGDSSGCLEWLCRDRRTILFADTTQLTPCRIRSNRRVGLLDQIKAHMWLDHVSYWQSAGGTIFILNEPYRISAKEVAALRAAGFSVCQVPTNLAPYCGRWDAQPGALPMTTSFLITEAKNASELIAIEQRLKRANESAAPWNSLLGVYYV